MTPKIKNKLSRREILKSSIFLFAFLLGCKEKKFIRPAKIHDLGPLKDLLYTKVYLRERRMLMFRDEQGWSILSTRCSYDGCDLTYQERTLYCPCCRGHYDHKGVVLDGPEREALPWFAISYKEGHLFADTGKIVDANYRFTTPQLESAIKKLNLEIREQKITDVHVPDILLGEKPVQKGRMFRENDPNEVYEAEMIK